MSYHLFALLEINVPDWVEDILKEAVRDSPTLVICLLIVWIAFGYVRKEHESHLTSKNSEIDRLVEEKNRLQEIILSKRLSTLENSSPPKRSNKDKKNKKYDDKDKGGGR